MKRELVQTTDRGMAVVDGYTDLFMQPFYHACILVEEMRPVTVCKTIGSFKNRQQAEDAAKAALAVPNGHYQSEAT